MRISWSKSKKSLATLWFIGAGFVFVVLLLQTILGRYGENAKDAWSWLLPTIVPTLSLIVSVFILDTFEKGAKIKMVDGFMFRLCFSLSAVYLIVVALTVLLQPFSKFSPLELMKTSNLWLGPFQGLVSASLGAFFIRGEKE